MKSFTFKCSNLLPCLLHHILLDRLQTHLLPLPGLLSRPLPLLRKYLLIYWTWDLLCFTLGGGEVSDCLDGFGTLFPHVQMNIFLSWGGLKLFGHCKNIWGLFYWCFPYIVLLLRPSLFLYLPFPQLQFHFPTFCKYVRKRRVSAVDSRLDCKGKRGPMAWLMVPCRQAGCTYQRGNFSRFYSVLIRIASKTKINLTIIRQWQIR